jgi:prefoldin subunit 5
MIQKRKISVNELLNMVTSMNERDKKNLEFLLNVSPKQYAEWYISVDEDDLKYADELLVRAGNEIYLKLNEEKMDKVEETNEAQALLKKFQLNK